MMPDRSVLLEKTGITIPLIGLYDAPEKAPFAPFTQPKQCIFESYREWLKGKSIFITEDNFTCGGAGYTYCGVMERKRDDFLEFLAGTEGLKESKELMSKWLEKYTPYQREHKYIIIGPLRDDQFRYLRTVTFFVNPDQLSALMTGAQYHASPEDPRPVIAPFGSGCSMLVSLFSDLDTPQALVGSTDIAMRQHLPSDILSLTVTVPMYRRLCRLDGSSFLFKPFWKRVMKARGMK
ncbi:MAG: hypothetical protein GF417_11110 [Candidatus Latescibacteria bacterium]|nr:hypothetical protein [Candidatus Latescibacterota bacterium]